MDDFPVFKRWVIPSIYGCEKTVMQEAAAEMIRLFPEGSPSRLEDIQTVIAEACLNAIEHGNGCDANLTVTIQLTAERDKVSFRIQDHGSAAAVIDRNPDVPSSDKWELPRPRGWGLTIIGGLSDHYEFGRCEGKTYLDIIFYW